MLLQCTKRLLDELNITPDERTETDSLSCWHGNIVTINQEKAIVLINDKNKYVNVIYGLKDSDLKDINAHIFNIIRETLEKEQIDKTAIKKYLEQEIIYSKTHNRSLTSRLSHICKTLSEHEELTYGDSIYKSELSLKLSRQAVANGKEINIIPNQEMRKDFEKYIEERVPVSTTPINKSPDEKLSVIKKSRRIKKKKIGRNEPCPCGSGKKYKKCCLGKEYTECV